MYFCDYETSMKRKGLYKIVNVFKIVDIIIDAVFAVINVVKEFASINWGKWAESRVGEYMIKFLQAAILLPFWLFMFHKMRPETFDVYGHMRN